MSLHKEKIEKGRIRNLFAPRRAGVHKWMKRQMNKFMRRRKIDIRNNKSIDDYIKEGNKSYAEILRVMSKLNLIEYLKNYGNKNKV